MFASAIIVHIVWSKVVVVFVATFKSFTSKLESQPLIVVYMYLCICKWGINLE